MGKKQKQKNKKPKDKRKAINKKKGISKYHLPKKKKQHQQMDTNTGHKHKTNFERNTKTAMKNRPPKPTQNTKVQHLFLTYTRTIHCKKTYKKQSK
jgi:hypothetical protein